MRVLRKEELIWEGASGKIQRKQGLHRAFKVHAR